MSKKNQKLVESLKKNPEERKKVILELMLKVKKRLRRFINSPKYNFLKNKDEVFQETLQEAFRRMYEKIDEKNFKIEKSIDKLFWGVCVNSFKELFLEKDMDFIKTKEVLPEPVVEISHQDQSISFDLEFYELLKKELSENEQEILNFKYESNLYKKVKAYFEGSLVGQQQVYGLVNGYIDYTSTVEPTEPFEGNFNGYLMIEKHDNLIGKVSGKITEDQRNKLKQKDQYILQGILKSQFDGYADVKNTNRYIQNNLEGSLVGKFEYGRSRSTKEVQLNFNIKSEGYTRKVINDIRAKLYDIVKNKTGIVIKKKGEDARKKKKLHELGKLNN